MNRRQLLASLGASCILAFAKKASAVVSLNLTNIFYPRHARFKELKKLINPALTPEDPVAIVRTRDLAEIQTALNFCQTTGQPVRVRGGGHSFEGFSMGSGFVFDVREFRTFSVNSNHVVAGAGLTLGELKSHLEVHGLSFPTGTCPSVGLGGYLLGGGHSLKSRLWGLGADRVQAMKVILANGDRLLVSPDQYADLYWALLGGGGGNFALVEEFYLDLIPTGKDLIFSYIFPQKNARKVFEFWEKHALQADHSTTAQLLFSFKSGEIERVQIYGMFNCINLQAGDPSEIFARSVWQQLHEFGPSFNELRLESSNKARHDGEFSMPFKGHSHYAEKTIGVSGFDHILETAKATLSGTAVSIVFETLGGQIFNPSRSNSYPHRHCLYSIEFYAGFRKLEQKEFYSQSLTRFHQGIAPLFSGRCYVNYPNADLGKKALNHYFGQNLSSLLRIKKKYDPANKFDYGIQSLAESLRDL